MSGIETISNVHFGSKTFRSPKGGGPVATAAFTLHEEKEKTNKWNRTFKIWLRVKGGNDSFLLSDRCGSPRVLTPAVVPVALPGPTELYLSQVNKSFWHYKIFKGGRCGRCGRAVLAGGRVREVAAGEARFKNFLNFYGMTACFTSASPSAALCFRLLRE